MSHTNQSFHFRSRPVITAWASVAGKKESQGPLGHCFDKSYQDSYFGQPTWEQAEQELQKNALHLVIQKNHNKKPDVVFSGDLLNQCTSSAFAMNNQPIPHIGLYGACSTMAESLILGGMCVDAGFFSSCVAISSSHFAASERQYRFPLSYGGQRPPTSQWTVTGAGAVFLESQGQGPKLESCTIGCVQELGIQDANNMGAAMAPAALDTIRTHFAQCGTSPEDYDRIITGDLGQLGKELLLELARKDGLSLGGKLEDCGTMVFDLHSQDVHSGGSGCGCSSIVLCSKLLKNLSEGKLKRILFCGTGALLSPVSVQQKQPIPAICHAVSILGG